MRQDGDSNPATQDMNLAVGTLSTMPLLPRATGTLLELANYNYKCGILRLTLIVKEAGPRGTRDQTGSGMKITLAGWEVEPTDA